MTGHELLAQARKHLWAAWALSSEELASQAADTLFGLGMLVPEGGATELVRLRSQLVVSEQRSERRRIAWRMARTRALSTGSAADRYAERARQGQEALQDMLFTVIVAQMACRAARQESEELRSQVAELLEERHSTNESLSKAAEALRENRDRIVELERPAVERHRREVRESYRWLASHAREDGDFEGEAVVSQQLAEREQLWRQEDKLAREFAADPLAARPWEPGPSTEASADKLTALFAPTQALREDEPAEVFVPRTERSHWVSIADALNAAHAAGMPVGIDLDGTLTDHNAWSVVWDRTAEQWTVAGYEDGCPQNVIDGDVGGHFFKKGALADSPVACSYCGAKRPESGGAK